jgi:UPF0042 nucleotide-binding protein
MSEEPPSETYPSGLPRPKIPFPDVRPDIIIVTGMSGAGRSNAADVLADLGWYVVDNLPPSMLAEMIGVVAREGYRRLAAVVDVRGGRLFADLQAVINDLVAAGIDLRIVFMEASDEVLVRRFEQVRRPHPLQGEGTLLETIRLERATLKEMRERADIVIDTSDTNVREFAARLIAEVGEGDDDALIVNVISFGFKNGVPPDADFVADVRFIDNPHWVPDLRPLTGLDQPVRDFVLAGEGAMEFIDALSTTLKIALGRYRAHDKHVVTVAIGCTGGRHRSVAIAEEVAERLRGFGYTVRASHRDKGGDE